MKVVLTFEEIEEAATIGVRRRVMALKRRRPAFHGYQNGKKDGSLPPFELDIQSSCAEKAVSKALNQEWIGMIAEDLKTVPCDVAPNVQVRWTPRPDGRLIVHHDAKETDLYVLVTGEVPEFNVIGSISGKDAKNEKFWWDGARSPAYFIPQSSLSPIV